MYVCIFIDCNLRNKIVSNANYSTNDKNYSNDANIIKLYKSKDNDNCIDNYINL